MPVLRTAGWRPAARLANAAVPVCGGAAVALLCDDRRVRFVLVASPASAAGPASGAHHRHHRFIVGPLNRRSIADNHGPIVQSSLTHSIDSSLGPSNRRSNMFIVGPSFVRRRVFTVMIKPLSIHCRYIIESCCRSFIINSSNHRQIITHSSHNHHLHHRRSAIPPCRCTLLGGAFVSRRSRRTCCLDERPCLCCCCAVVYLRLPPCGHTRTANFSDNHLRCIHSPHFGSLLLGIAWRPARLGWWCLRPGCLVPTVLTNIVRCSSRAHSAREHFHLGSGCVAV
jgi:hypothetical protein